MEGEEDPASVRHRIEEAARIVHEGGDEAERKLFNDNRNDPKYK